MKSLLLTAQNEPKCTGFGTTCPISHRPCLSTSCRGSRVGAPRFLGGILIIWGLVAGLFAWMRTATQFYVLRFVLGLAESGAYPGNTPPPCRSCCKAIGAPCNADRAVERSSRICAEGAWPSQCIAGT